MSLYLEFEALKNNSVLFRAHIDVSFQDSDLFDFSFGK